MSYQFDFDPVHGTLRTRFEGDVTDEELVEFYKGAGAAVALTDPLRGLIDFSACTRFDVTADTVRRLAKSTPALPKPAAPRAIVAPTDRMFGMARIFEIEGETTRPNIHIVRTLAEALVILGIFGEARYQSLESFRTGQSQESDESAEPEVANPR
jgi:hypothetical protein